MATKIYIGADHAGFKLKEKLKKWLEKKKIEYEDLGAKILDKNDDYPDYAEKVAKKVVKEKSLGILICGSAQGICIAANKIKGVRAVVPFSLKEAELSRQHEMANIICLSGWYFNPIKAQGLAWKFLRTPFSKDERHIRRINKIKALE
ncbi:MAG TPA: RpiB/LacA/LacB family sugar-phosphate isomerase [Candidatus Nanoarchaeia archaeon]|nr:RpiB/LacA/LacB family sugar-phosphate isomerase [Candidatus Nanoarchaeia archaeon]